MAGASGHWVAVPTTLPTDPRFMVLPTEAKLLLYQSWGYASQHSTDGAIPPSALPLLTMGFTTPAAVLMDDLRNAGLVVPGKRAQAGQDVLADYLDINPTAQQVKKKSDHAHKAAMARWAKTGTEDASGNASGTDGQSTEDASGNAPNPPDLPDPTEQDPGDVDLGIRFSVVGENVGERASEELGDEPELTPGEKRKVIADIRTAVKRSP